MSGISLKPLDDAIEWAAREQAGRHVDGDPVWRQEFWLNVAEGCGTACCVAGRIALAAGYVPTETNKHGDVNWMRHPRTGHEGGPAAIAYRIVLGDHANVLEGAPYRVMDDLTDPSNNLDDIRGHRDVLARLAASGW